MRKTQAAGRNHRLAGLRGNRKRRSTGGSLDMGGMGRDQRRSAPRLRTARILPPLLATLLVALGLAALRIDLLRIRYAVAASTLQEQELHDESRELTAHMRRLRDPVHLTERARALGFVRPDRLIELVAEEPVSKPSDPAPTSRQLAAHRAASFPGTK